MAPEFLISTLPSGLPNLALACAHKEYPNKISHNLNSVCGCRPASKADGLHFYGCYDWQLVSARGIGLLARLVRAFPNASFAPSARESSCGKSLTTENIAQEADVPSD